MTLYDALSLLDDRIYQALKRYSARTNIPIATVLFYSDEEFEKKIFDISEKSIEKIKKVREKITEAHENAIQK